MWGRRWGFRRGGRRRDGAHGASEVCRVFVVSSGVRVIWLEEHGRVASRRMRKRRFMCVSECHLCRVSGVSTAAAGAVMRIPNATTLIIGRGNATPTHA